MRQPPASWATPLELTDLKQEQIHLWRFRLDLSSGAIDQLQPLLSSDERVRAKRLLDPLKSRNFVAARGRLRQLLAPYLKLPPEGIRFNYGPKGKPEVATAASSGLRFNLAHSGYWALLGVGNSYDLGVDLEMVDAHLVYAPMVTHFFSAEECARVAAAAEERRRRVFYREWTRKEAWMKRQGGGFSEPHVKPEQNQNNYLKIYNIPIAKGYIGALCQDARVTTVLRFNGC